jgi:hypothetical protein
VANQPANFTRGAALSIAALVLAGCGVVIALATYLFGRVEGVEFNPHSFERRQFSFYEIPLLRLQVTPLSRTIHSGEVEQLVKTQKYVVPPPGVSPQWHLVSLRRNSLESPPTDALILQRYFDASDDDSHRFWHEWSVAHPALAKVLWTAVARYAQHDLYLLLPPLFELASNAQEESSFVASLHKLQVEQLQEFAAQLQKQSTQNGDPQQTAQRNQRRVELLTLANELRPDDVELQAELQAARAAAVGEPAAANSQLPGSATSTAAPENSSVPANSAVPGK